MAGTWAGPQADPNQVPKQVVPDSQSGLVFEATNTFHLPPATVAVAVTRRETVSFYCHNCVYFFIFFCDFVIMIFDLSVYNWNYNYPPVYVYASA